MNRSLLNLVNSLILAVMIRFSFEDSFKINRKVDVKANEVWWAARDKFSISQSVCSRITGSNKCSKFSASTAHFSNPCSCICHWDKTTFMNKCGKWQCIDDRTIRQQEGCAILFNGVETLSSRLTYLNPIETVKFHIPIQIGKTCDINETASSYLSCNGEWLPVKQKLAGRRFILQYKPQGDTPSMKQYELMVQAVLGTPDITGRLIKLAFTCTPRKLQQCLLFKIVGSYTCQESQPRPKSCVSTSGTIVPTPSVSHVAMATKITAKPDNLAKLHSSPSSSAVTLQSLHVSTAATNFKVFSSLSNVAVTTRTNTLKSRRRNNTMIAIVCGVAAFAVVAVLISAVVATSLHKRKSRNITNVPETSKKERKRRFRLPHLTSETEAVESNQVKPPTGLPPPPYSPEDGKHDEQRVINNGLILELKSRLRNSIRALSLSAWQNRSNANSSVRELEDSFNGPSKETVDHDEDSDDYVDEDWGSFSESDGSENGDAEQNTYVNKIEINIYDIPDGIPPKCQGKRNSRVSCSSRVSRTSHGPGPKSGVRKKRKSTKPCTSGFGNQGFQPDGKELHTESHFDDDNIYEVLKEG